MFVPSFLSLWAMLYLWWQVFCVLQSKGRDLWDAVFQGASGSSLTVSFVVFSSSVPG